jgi:membrane protein implicated in regulation of membrane protease activity
MNNMLQINSLAGPSTSLSKVLLIFYLVIAGNFTKNLVSKQLKTFFEENRMAQHAIALITLLVLIISTGGVVDTKIAIIYTMIGYVWFIFTTKLDAQWNMVIILILVAGYLYENSIDNKTKMMNADKSLKDSDKKIIVEKDSMIKSYIVIGALVVTVIGTVMYSNKKHVQYGGGYNWLTYMLY